MSYDTYLTLEHCRVGRCGVVGNIFVFGCTSRGFESYSISLQQAEVTDKVPINVGNSSVNSLVYML